MNWLAILRDQSPQLLVVCPLVGSIVTGLAAWANRHLVRQLALSNLLCTIAICGVVTWDYQVEAVAEKIARQPTTKDYDECGSDEATIAMVHRRADSLRVERFERRYFEVDGLNIWPAIVALALSGMVIAQAANSTPNSAWFLVTVLLFQAACFASLTAVDLIVYLTSYGMAILAMSMLLGLWGGLERRSLFERFLKNQFCGSALISLGFAMLVVAIPWMKIEDAPSPLGITFNISRVTHEIQKWTATNGAAYQYELEALPWITLVLSIGFAILFGAFPFHATQAAILSDAPSEIVALYVAGFLPLSALGWFRFTLPIAPDVLVAFDWLILFSGLCGAFWAALRSWSPAAPRRRWAFVFVSLSGLALLGCFSFSRFGMSGAWLMLQQLLLAFSTGLLLISSSTIFQRANAALDSRRDLALKVKLLMLVIVGVGLYSSGFIIVSELFREMISSIAAVDFGASSFTMLCELVGDALMVALGLSSCIVLAASIFSLVEVRGSAVRLFTSRDWLVNALVLLLLLTVNGLPNLMLHLCEPEFARAFRRFEPIVPAGFAEPDSDERQSSP